MTDPSIFAMVCEQRDRAQQDRDDAIARNQQMGAEMHALRVELALKDESLDALARQAQDASDGLAARQLAVGIRAVLAYVRLHERHTYAPDEMPRVNAVRAWLVENGARLHGDEAVYAAAEAHGTAVRR